MCSKESPVRLEKVSFESGVVAAGLKACKPIGGSMPILATCSSMSSDIVKNSKNVISVVLSSSCQRGPQGPRLILGPFRFANHDCNPNCQVSFGVYSIIGPHSHSVRSDPSKIRTPAFFIA